ncbi:hypothetical protein [Roseobacter sp.]|uniref:hypothetical protein n=1 Tax=Roseobacter sp. TaxID=1907202 RepID=UPI003299B157
MHQLSVIKTTLENGHWHGLISGPHGAEPAISVTHLGVPVPDVAVAAVPDGTGWSLDIPIPATAIADGVQTILITDTRTGICLESITLIAGEITGDDLRAQVDLLRSELETLKRAFRQHCADTT